MKHNYKMMKSLAVIFAIILSHGVNAQHALVNPQWDYNKIGKIQARTTQEIVGSDLWIGGEVLDRDYADYDAYKSYLDSLGAKKIRLQSGWAKTEKVKGKYDFEWLDKIVNDAISRRIQPWIQVSYGNNLYKGAGGTNIGEGLPSSEEGILAWTNYVKALVKHFDTRVYEWEIWNEPDHMHGNPGPEPYSRLYYETAKVIREVQPNSKLIGLSIAVVKNTSYVTSFFKYLQDRNALDLISVVTFHGYPQNPDVGLDNVEKLKAVIYEYVPGLPMWQGETGCPSTPGSSGALAKNPWTELTQAKWNLRRAVNFVGRGYPFSLFSISEYTYDAVHQKGLNTKGILKINEKNLSIARAKPAYHAYQNLTAILDHQMERLPSVRYTLQSDSSHAVYVFRHKVSELPMIFLWRNGSIPTDANKFMKQNITVDAINFKQPVIIEMLTGDVYELTDKDVAYANNEIILKNIPVFDSPVVITDRSLIKMKEVMKK